MPKFCANAWLTSWIDTPRRPCDLAGLLDLVAHLHRDIDGHREGEGPEIRRCG
jgi:hypothetical protein